LTRVRLLQIEFRFAHPEVEEVFSGSIVTHIVVIPKAAKVFVPWVSSIASIGLLVPLDTELHVYEVIFGALQLFILPTLLLFFSMTRPMYLLIKHHFHHGFQN